MASSKHQTLPRLGSGLALLALVLVTPVEASSARLPRSTPEEQGVSSSAILGFLEAADAEVDSMHSFMLLRHGKVIAEAWWNPYTPEDPHVLYSLSKSFTSTAVGLAISEGRLGLDDTVVSFFPDELPDEPSDNLKNMRVRDLLAMSTGHHNEDLAGFDYNSRSATRAFLALPVAHKPGTHFVYNTPATFMASAIVQKVMGVSVLDYLRPRLFDPLGIENPTWDANPLGISLGGFGLSIRTEDIASFGQLLLQKGAWQGKQLVPAEWVEAATSRQVSNGSNPKSDWEQGYGYQFWRCRNGAYRGDGAFGQYAIVLPAQDAVIAITSATRDMQGVMNLVWGKLLPALGESALPADPAAHTKLVTRAADLRVAIPNGMAASPEMARASRRTYTFPANPLLEAVTPTFTRTGGEFALRLEGREYPITVTHGKWNRKNTLVRSGRRTKAAAAGSWTSPDTYRLDICDYESPHCLWLNLRFAGEEVTLDAEQNVAFGPTKLPTIVGKAEPKRR